MGRNWAEAWATSGGMRQAGAGIWVSRSLYFTLHQTKLYCLHFLLYPAPFHSFRRILIPPSACQSILIYCALSSFYCTQYRHLSIVFWVYINLHSCLNLINVINSSNYLNSKTSNYTKFYQPKRRVRKENEWFLMFESHFYFNLLDNLSVFAPFFWYFSSKISSTKNLLTIYNKKTHFASVLFKYLLFIHITALW